MKILLYIVAFFSFHAYCQELKTVYDVGLWTGVETSYKLNKSYKLSFGQDIRLDRSLASLSKLDTDLGLDYRINKNFDLNFGVRYAYAREKDRSFAQDFRYNIDFKVRLKKIKKITFDYRFRYQTTYENLFGYDLDDTKLNFRNRLKVSYDLGEHELYFSSELFREYIVFKKPYFNKFRLNLGDKVNLFKGKLNYALSLEQELNDENPLTFVFLQLYYSFKLK